MSDLKEKLDCPITYCTSSSETYKSLQDHMVRKNTKNANSVTSLKLYAIICLRLSLLNPQESEGCVFCLFFSYWGFSLFKPKHQHLS